MYHASKDAAVKAGKPPTRVADVPTAAEAAAEVVPDAVFKGRLEKHGKISTFSPEANERRQQVLHVITTVGDMRSFGRWDPEARLHDSTAGSLVFGLTFRPDALAPNDGPWKNGDQLVKVDGRSALTRTPDGAAQLRTEILAREPTDRVELKFFRPTEVDEETQRAFKDVYATK